MLEHVATFWKMLEGILTYLICVLSDLGKQIDLFSLSIMHMGSPNPIRPCSGNYLTRMLYKDGATYDLGSGDRRSFHRGSVLSWHVVDSGNCP